MSHEADGGESGEEPRQDARSAVDGEALRERVYATFTGLAIVLVQSSSVDHISPVRAIVTLAVGILAIAAAGFAAQLVAEVATTSRFPDREEFRRMFRVSGSAIASAAVPVLVLVLAAFGIIDLGLALGLASVVYVLILGLVGYIAVRRTRAPWWQQLVALGALVALGVAVIVIQQIAHGH
ncbi:hypothetical protein [Microbacterium paraoxydans]|uniref:hypothetical protein n=1 Tax=Microbacterium paraoxydans TaxID=199592 RepID=UPI001CFC44B0|nr:hypothetical protein [Microbacterium paraoxydans]